MLIIYQSDTNVSRQSFVSDYPVKTTLNNGTLASYVSEEILDAAGSAD